MTNSDTAKFPRILFQDRYWSILQESRYQIYFGCAELPIPHSYLNRVIPDVIKEMGLWEVEGMWTVARAHTGIDIYPACLSDFRLIAEEGGIVIDSVKDVKVTGKIGEMGRYGRVHIKAGEYHIYQRYGIAYYRKVPTVRIEKLVTDDPLWDFIGLPHTVTIPFPDITLPLPIIP